MSPEHHLKDEGKKKYKSEIKKLKQQIKNMHKGFLKELQYYRTVKITRNGDEQEIKYFVPTEDLDEATAKILNEKLDFLNNVSSTQLSLYLACKNLSFRIILTTTLNSLSC